jgi:hypothetical protein
MNVSDFRLEEKPTFLNFLFQGAGGQDNPVGGFKAHEAFHGCQGDHRIQTNSMLDLQIIVQRYELNTPILDAWRQVIGHHPITRVAQSAIQVTLKRPVDGTIRAKGLGNLPPGSLQFSLYLIPIDTLITLCHLFLLIFSLFPHLL